MRIALDVDGVLADVMRPWTVLCNQRHGTRLQPSDLTTWDFWAKCGISRAEFFRIFSQVWRNWRRVPATEPELGKRVGALAQFGVVDIVTGRTRDTLPHVQAWLTRQQIPFHDFVVVSPRGTKANLQYDLYIDDAPKNVLAAARQGRFAFVYDQPWNRNLPPHAYVRRINDLADAVCQIPHIFATRR